MRRNDETVKIKNPLAEYGEALVLGQTQRTLVVLLLFIVFEVLDTPLGVGLHATDVHGCPDSAARMKRENCGAVGLSKLDPSPLCFDEGALHLRKFFEFSVGLVKALYNSAVDCIQFGFDLLLVGRRTCVNVRSRDCFRAVDGLRGEGEEDKR